MKPDGILIIGGTGFIGGSLAKRMVSSGRQVHVLGRHADQAKDTGAILHRGSLDDTNLLRKILPVCGTVIHAASTTTPGTSAHQPSLEAMQNILPTLRFLEVLREFENREVLFFSSGGTFYGNPGSTPVSEQQVFSPQSYYGAGKVAIEAFLHAYQGQGGGAVTILRPSNVYGAGQAFRPGFGIIRTMLEHAIHGTTLDIWGDGEVVRDFIYVDDLVSACALLLQDGLPAGSFNLGYGQGYSINQVLYAIETTCDCTIKINYLPARQVDVKAIVLNTQRLQTKLSWSPSISLEQGVKMTWDSLQKAATQ